MKSSSIDLKALLAKSLGFLRILIRHLSFILTLLVLFVYLFVVWQIRNLAAAEPAPEDETRVETVVPKIDPKAIDQIQSLENSSPEVHSLFNQARNNPFNE